jgi:alkylation response protein AidB-like acyl-CoA dehydrogenase
VQGGSVDADDLVAPARRLADDVLFPQAQAVERSTIPASHFDALRGAGLFSFTDVPPGAARRSMAAIAGGCGATFFVWVQHHGVVRNVASSSNPDLRGDLLPSLLDGSIIAGTAFAHVRRTGSTAVRATRVDGGWRLDGRAPWATSWGIAERFTIAATTDDGQMVWAVLPGNGGPGVATDPLDLAVFSATGTVAIRFDNAPVADADVLAVQDADRWREADRLRASVGAPAVLGVADRAIRLLRDAARGKNDRAHAAAGRLESQLAERWSTDDALTARLAQQFEHATDDELRDELIATASAHRAACLDLGHRATTALLAAIGGRGMDLTHPAQRLAREAAFYVIQAQTRDGRAATLDAV